MSPVAMASLWSASRNASVAACTDSPFHIDYRDSQLNWRRGPRGLPRETGARGGLAGGRRAVLRRGAGDCYRRPPGPWPLCPTSYARRPNNGCGMPTSGPASSGALKRFAAEDSAVYRPPRRSSIPAIPERLY